MLNKMDELKALQVKMAKLESEIESMSISSAALSGSEYKDVQDISVLKQRLQSVENNMTILRQENSDLRDATIKLYEHITNMAKIMNHRLKEFQTSSIEDESEFSELSKSQSTL